MSNKWYVMFYDHYDQPCGCPATRSTYLYDSTGNERMYFKTKEEALAAGKAHPKSKSYDDWEVIHRNGYGR